MNRARLIAACSLAALPRAVRAQSLGVLRLASAPGATTTPVIYALRTSMFARAGIDVQIQKASSGAAVAAAVVGGSADFGNASTPTLFEAHDRGVPITLVAPTQLYDAKAPNSGFLALKDAPLRNGKDFEGQVVSLASMGDTGSVVLRAWIDRNGGDSSKVRFVEVPIAAAAVAVEERRVAAGEMNYPALGAALDTGKFRNITVFDLVGPFTNSAWFTTQDFSSKHAELIRSFVRVYAESVAYVNAHFGDTIEMMAEFTGQPAEVLRRLPRFTFGPRLAPVQFQNLIDLSAKYGAIKKPFPAREMFDVNALGSDRSARSPERRA
jgi:NitT/TauT family transport system substrate-binding protein